MLSIYRLRADVHSAVCSDFIDLSIISINTEAPKILTLVVGSQEVN